MIFIAAEGRIKSLTLREAPAVKRDFSSELSTLIIHAEPVKMAAQKFSTDRI